MPNNPRVYRSDNAPGTPEQGDIRYNQANNQIECFDGSAWGGITFANATVTGLTATTAVTTGNATLNTASVGTITASNFIFAAGYVSLNTTSPAFYIPAGAGTLTGVIPSLANRVAFAYDTTNSKIMVRFGGSWFQTGALTVA